MRVLLTYARNNSCIHDSGWFIRLTKTIFTTVFLLFITINLSPQDIDTGFKYTKNYTRKEHNWHQQNWAVIQDNRGCMYVGNQGALLEFDGVNWRRHIIPNLTVRSLALDEKNGTIYVGGRGEIGYLQTSTDGKGVLQYHSLLPQVPKSKQNFANVVRTHYTNEGIYFRTGNYLFHFRPSDNNGNKTGDENGKLTVAAETDNNHRFKGSFYCCGELFLRKDNVGLMRLVHKKGVQNPSLEPVPGGEIFAGKSIYMMAPYPGEKLLIGTRGYGLFLFHSTGGGGPFETGADDFLLKNQLTYGIRLLCGDYVLSTKRGGMVVIDRQGIIKRFYTKDTGLLDNYVSYMYEDDGGNLWATQDEGISKIEHGSPFSIYDERSGLPGVVTAAAVHGTEGDLYVGTNRGVFFRTCTGPFIAVPGMSQKCAFLLSTGERLVAATDNGVFLVDKKGGRMITSSRSYVICPSRVNEKRLWVGTFDGLVSLMSAPGNDPPLYEEHNFTGMPNEIHSIVEDTDGRLWMGTLASGVVTVTFLDDDFSSPRVNAFEPPDSLILKAMHVFQAGNRILFGTEAGLYTFNEKNNTFVPDNSIGKKFADGTADVFRLVEDKNNHIWLHSEKRNIEAVRQPDGTFILNRQPFLRLPRAQVNVILPDLKCNNVWFGGSDGLIRYDTSAKKNYSRGFKTLIRKVIVNGEPVYDGYPPPFTEDDGKHTTGDINHNIPSSHVFEYENRNFRFQFAAPFYEGESVTRIRYQVLLEGYDSQWSDPSIETGKDYTNLDSGSYTFRVKGENLYGISSPESRFSFKILPPWYKTWWMFLLYGLVAVFLVFLLIKWRLAKLEGEKKRLENLVKERTGEIREKNRQLETQTSQLKEQSEKLTEMDHIKTRFFANISHEFRTPLTLIMGPLQEMIGQSTKPEDAGQKKKLGLMLRNSHRLLNLINRLLELSKIESGKMELEGKLEDFITFLKGVVASFEPVALQKRLEMSFVHRENSVILFFDAEKMEEVVFNLLSNAVKFTPPGGKIVVAVKLHKPDGNGFPSGSVTLSVSDTGPGISRKQMERVFDRFYQSDSTNEHRQKGSGIGLTIAKELVELHRGRLDVHSIEGEGTQFIVTLPLYKDPTALEGTTGGERVDDSSTEGTEGKGSGNLDEKIRMMMDSTGVGEESEGGGTEEAPSTVENNKNIILVVEDNADTRAYIRGALEPLYHVVEADDGEHGIEKALEMVPDLIVSDVMMPGIDGYELCRELKNHVNTSHIPIILLTARAGEEDVLEGLETGADDYVTKPFNTKILCARIKNLIDMRSHLQQVLDRDMNIQPAKMPVSNIDKEFIAKLKKVIRANISDPDFNIEELCHKMEMSQPTLYRKIHALSGESPTEFIRSYRLKRAARLMEENFGSVIEIAVEVGFSSAAYFTKCFKKKFNQLPSQFNNGHNTGP